MWVLSQKQNSIRWCSEACFQLKYHTYPLERSYQKHTLKHIHSRFATWLGIKDSCRGWINATTLYKLYCSKKVLLLVQVVSSECRGHMKRKQRCCALGKHWIKVLEKKFLLIYVAEYGDKIGAAIEKVNFNAQLKGRIGAKNK